MLRGKIILDIDRSLLLNIGGRRFYHSPSIFAMELMDPVCLFVRDSMTLFELPHSLVCVDIITLHCSAIIYRPSPALTLRKLADPF